MIGTTAAARLALLGFLCCLQAATQISAPEREISGTVTDATGATVPDARVTVVSRSGKALASTLSHRDGAFRLSGLQLSAARIEIRRQGFNLFVAQLDRASYTKPLTVVLKVADLPQQIDITSASAAGQVSPEPAENRDAAMVDDTLLEHLPVFDQGYIGVVSNFLDPAATGNAGATIVVDGMEQKNAGVTASAIQSVKINNDPYSAEYSRPGRGRIEITTKTPNSAYHGTLNAIFRDYHLDARNAFATSRATEQRRIFEGELTGAVPALKRTYFLLSADYQQDNIQSVVFARIPAGLLEENTPSPIRAKDLASRVLHNFSDDHTISLQFTYEGQSSENQLSSGQNQSPGQNPGAAGSSTQTQAYGGYVLPEAGQNISSIERHLTFFDRLFISPRIFNQLQLTYERNRNSTASNTEQPQIVVENAFTGGGAQATQLATENNLDIRDVLTWTHGSNTITSGVAMPNLSRRGLDDYSKRLGVFSFYSLQDYELGHPYSFSEQSGPVHFVYWQKEVGSFVQDQIRISPRLVVTMGVRWDWQNELHRDNDFAPRASIAYALGAKRQTVLRAGGGIFFDRTSSRPLGILAEYSAPALRSILLLNPAFPNPSLNGLVPSVQPVNLYRFSPNIRTPYLDMYSLSIERQLRGSATLSATYRGMIGVSLFRSLDVNQPLPPFYSGRPDPRYGVYQQVQSSGRQVSQALDLSFSGKVSRYFSGLAQYTLSQTRNNTSGINYLPPNTYDLTGEYGRADFDQRHRFNMLVSSTPHPWLDLGVGVTATSGLPYTETLGLDIYNSGFANARPSGVARNSLQGPGFVEVDARWSHEFLLSKKRREGRSVTFAADAFNLLNHVNDTRFIGNERSPFFGQAVSAFPARRLQFTLRLKF